MQYRFLRSTNVFTKFLVYIWIRLNVDSDFFVDRKYVDISDDRGVKIDITSRRPWGRNLSNYLNENKIRQLYREKRG